MNAKVINIGGASLFKQQEKTGSQLATPKNTKELTEFLQNSLGCKGLSVPASDRHDRNIPREAIITPKTHESTRQSMVRRSSYDISE